MKRAIIFVNTCGGCPYASDMFNCNLLENQKDHAIPMFGIRDDCPLPDVKPNDKEDYPI